MASPYVLAYWVMTALAVIFTLLNIYQKYRKAAKEVEEWKKKHPDTPLPAPPEEKQLIGRGWIRREQTRLYKEGLDDASLIIGIDFTHNNSFKGARSFDGRCLHELSEECQNPYQLATRAIVSVLEPFGDDDFIHCFGFGDAKCGIDDCVPFITHRPCESQDEVLAEYKVMAQSHTAGDSCNIAPVIRRAGSIARSSKRYQVVVIFLAAGVDLVGEALEALSETQRLPMSVVLVGVGDGPWSSMDQLIDASRSRDYDNVTFVDFGKIMHRSGASKLRFAAKTKGGALEAESCCNDASRSLIALALRDTAGHLHLARRLGYFRRLNEESEDKKGIAKAHSSSRASGNELRRRA